MAILKLIPACKDYLWGGHRLVDEYNVDYQGDILAEAWELSCHPDGPSIIANGKFAGKSLKEYIDLNGTDVLGTHCRRFREFPILIKFIDARDNLSIQVHPDNRYALKNEGQYGKTEMWYVMDAGEDAFLYYGFNKEITQEEFARRIEQNNLLEVLNAVPVHKGDILFIESGTLHAIGKNILIAEIQQNSNVTYRVYDYGRVGKDGKQRDLHIEKALAVTRRVPIIKDNSSYPHVADCDYFTVDKLNLDGSFMKKMEGTVTKESFVSILFMEGEGTISNDGETLSFKKGDSFFLAAGSGSYVVEGKCDALVTTIREKAAPVRIGIDIRGSKTRIGLVDFQYQLLDEIETETKTDIPAEEYFTNVGRLALDLLEKHSIGVDQCVGIGVGVPGTIDRKGGIVRYSNNIGWNRVNVAEVISKVIPVPVVIGNDADCAALGESVAGVGKDYQDMVMLRIGTGVGVGVLLDGDIFGGRGFGGSELGHMVIVDGGELCTCGRRGCLEAYASIAGLKREAMRAASIEMSAQQIYSQSKAGDMVMRRVVDTYIHRLGTGVVNVANGFRPQLVILGGELPEDQETVLGPIREMLQKECFGREHGDVPEIAVSALGKNAGVIGAASMV